MSDVNKEIALKVTADTGQAQKAFKNAQQELEETRKALVDLALAGKQNSDEFKNLEQRAGAIQDAIGDVNARVTALANDTPKLQLFGEAVRGVAAGFSIAQGAAALFGDENEDLQKAILQVQGSMALLNGVQEIANLLNRDSALRVQANAIAQRVLQLEVVKSTLALRGWSAALAATGIGAVVVALGFLASAFISSTDASDDLTDSLERQKEQQEQLRKQIELTTKARELEIERQKLLGKNEKEIAVLRLELIAEQLAAQEAAVKTEQNNIKALEGFQNDDALRRRKLILQEKQFRLDELRNELIEQINIIREFEKNNTREAIGGNLTRLEARKANNIELTKEAKAAQDQEIADIMAAGARRFQAEAEAAEKQYQLKKQYRDLELADRQAFEQAIFNTAKGGFQAVADLAAFFAGQNEEQQKRAFELQKTASIAQTLIDTYTSAQAAYRSLVGIPVAGPVLAAVAAGTAIAAGLARVNAIRNTTFQSASTSAAPQAVRPAGIPTAPQPQAPGVFNPNTSTPTVPQQGNPNQPSPMPLRAYVVDRDIEQASARRNRLRGFAGI